MAYLLTPIPNAVYHVDVLGHHHDDEKSMSLEYEPSAEPLHIYVYPVRPVMTFPPSAQYIMSMYWAITTMTDYDPFIKSQLASTQLTVGPCVVQIWSRNTPKTEGHDHDCPPLCAVYHVDVLGDHHHDDCRVWRHQARHRIRGPYPL